jgi:hypothetical protein
VGSSTKPDKSLVVAREFDQVGSVDPAAVLITCPAGVARLSGLEGSGGSSQTILKAGRPASAGGKARRPRVQSRLMLTSGDKAVSAPVTPMTAQLKRSKRRAATSHEDTV